ncbi:MAG: hypothetical protein HQP61_02145 [Peptococcaceae bacterium]|nr:hypothetical protein [Candidatus Syntrophopropionicum ammoniitolerans]
MIDVSKIKYDLVLMTPDGMKTHLNNMARSIHTEENFGELAVRLEADIQNQQMLGGKWLHQHLQLGGQIVLLSDWGAGWHEIFRGTMFNWYYRTDPLGHLAVTAYDQLIYLIKSNDDRFYRAGTTAKAIIQDIAGAWGIPLGTIEGPDTVLAKQVLRGERLGDMIHKVLDQARKRGGGKWVARSKQGKIDVIKPGQNTPVYYFGADANVEQIEDQQDIENLVTRVKIIGAEDKEGRAPVVATLDGKTEFGILQDLVYQRQFDNATAAQAAAEEILAERGGPQKRRKVPAPDLPFLRRGDKVHVSAGTLIGDYVVAGVMRDIKARTMVMEVEDIG